MNTARANSAGAGLQTAALVFTGGSPATTATESWNGTSWTTVNSMNTARSNLTGGGTQTAAYGAGGFAPSIPSRTGATELWNGTSWAISSATMATAVQRAGGAGDQTAALVFGGNTTPGTGITTTQEFTGSTLTNTASTLTTS